MNARIPTATTLVIAFCSMLPARAADPQLLSLVMPDAKVLAGVNVQQAKATPFGLYMLGQIQSQDSHMQQLVQLTGFDPTRDVTELLAASTGDPKAHAGLALARGTFDPAKIAALAALHGALSETYNGYNILEDPKKTHGIAFLDSTLAVAGDLASVKGAIDRQRVPAAMPSDLSVQVSKLSLDEDAWVISTVPFSALTLPAAPPNMPNLTQSTAFQSIQQTSAGVKFGNNVVLTAQALADTAQNASAMADVVRLLVNVAQMQAQQNPQAAALVKSVVIAASGNKLSLSLSVPEDQFQQLFTHPKTGTAPNMRERRPMRGRQM